MARRTDLSHTLERARPMLGLSQLRAARRIGVARKTLWSWEQGRTVPNPAALAAILHVYTALDFEELYEMRERAATTRRKKNEAAA